MKKLYLLPILLIVISSCKPNPGNKKEAQSEKSAPSEEWIQLFNGKDLDGWTIKNVQAPYGRKLQQYFPGRERNDGDPL